MTRIFCFLDGFKKGVIQEVIFNGSCFFHAVPTKSDSDVIFCLQL